MDMMVVVDEGAGRDDVTKTAHCCAFLLRFLFLPPPLDRLPHLLRFVFVSIASW